MSSRKIPRDGIILDRSSSDALRQMRWERDVTMEKCATGLNIGVLEFMKKERGREPFTAWEFGELAGLLGTTAGNLLTKLEEAIVVVSEDLLPPSAVQA